MNAQAHRERAAAIAERRAHGYAAHTKVGVGWRVLWILSVALVGNFSCLCCWCITVYAHSLHSCALRDPDMRLREREPEREYESEFGMSFFFSILLMVDASCLCLLWCSWGSSRIFQHLLLWPPQPLHAYKGVQKDVCVCV